MIIRELCLENFTKIPQALQAGVERIELCDNLAVGGTTPSYGVIEEAAKYVAESKTTLAVMIRPRGGNFVYNSHELKIIETDTLKAVEAGAQNIVFGALTPGNEIMMFVTIVELILSLIFVRPFFLSLIILLTNFLLTKFYVRFRLKNK